MAVECPWCDYEGTVPSVEAHISGMADLDHQGRVGHQLHDYLPQPGEDDQAEESTEPGSVEGLADSVDDSQPVSASTILVVTLLFVVLVVAVEVAGSGSEEIASDDQEEDVEEVPALA